MSSSKKYQVVISSEIFPLPEKHELSAAQIIATHLKTDAKFIMRSDRKSPDIKVGNIFWEIKSPTGIGKRNIERQLQMAMKQSCNVILDSRRSKIHISKIRARLNYQANKTRGLKRLLLIDKLGKVEIIK